jgi:hypothetical protein
LRARGRCLCPTARAKADTFYTGTDPTNRRSPLQPRISIESALETDVLELHQLAGKIGINQLRRSANGNAGNACERR